MSNAELLAIGCMRVADSAHVVPGSARATCQICSLAIWIAPSSLGIIAAAVIPVTLLCLHCLKRSQLPLTIAPLTDEQRAEILVWYSRN